MGRSMARSPDACPYPKPFPADFDDCPAFQPRQFIPLDTLYQPLQPVLTCRHLETRALRERHRWYGACALGDAEARRRWAADVGTTRLAKIRQLQRQIGQAISGEMQHLWQLKGQQLQAYRNGTDTAAVTRELGQLSDRAMGDLTSYLKSHTDLLIEVGMPLDAMIELTRLSFDRFIEGRHSAEVTLEVPDSVLAGLSDPVRAFFRPTRPAQAPLS
jgi:hypothetical protein